MTLWTLLLLVELARLMRLLHVSAQSVEIAAYSATLLDLELLLCGCTADEHVAGSSAFVPLRHQPCLLVSSVLTRRLLVICIMRRFSLVKVHLSTLRTQVRMIQTTFQFLDRAWVLEPGYAAESALPKYLEHALLLTHVIRICCKPLAGYFL